MNMKKFFTVVIVLVVVYALYQMFLAFKAIVASGESLASNVGSVLMSPFTAIKSAYDSAADFVSGSDSPNVVDSTSPLYNLTSANGQSVNDTAANAPLYNGLPTNISTWTPP